MAQRHRSGPKGDQGCQATEVAELGKSAWYKLPGERNFRFQDSDCLRKWGLGLTESITGASRDKKTKAIFV
jgi:hypothetical protein